MRDDSRALRLWVLLTSDAPSRARGQNKLAIMSRDGGALAIIDRLGALLVPEGTCGEYVAGAVWCVHDTRSENADVQCSR